MAGVTAISDLYFDCVQALEARRSERNWRDRVGSYGVAIEQQREDTLDITSDMLRQYKVRLPKRLC